MADTIATTERDSYPGLGRVDGEAPIHPARPYGIRFGVAWSSDSSRVVSGGSDGTVKVWASAGRTLRTYVALGQRNKNWIVGVAFSRDGSQVMAGMADMP